MSQLHDQSGNLWRATWNNQVANLPFWAKLLSFDGSKFYSWEEVEPAPVASFIPIDGGRFGSLTLNPVYEINGLGLKTPAFVLIKRAYFDPGMDWVYAVVDLSASASINPGGLGGLIVADSNYPFGVKFSNVNLIELDTSFATLTGGLSPPPPSPPPGSSFSIYTYLAAAAAGASSSSSPGYVTNTDQGIPNGNMVGKGKRFFYQANAPTAVLLISFALFPGPVSALIDVLLPPISPLPSTIVRFSDATDITSATFGGNIEVDNRFNDLDGFSDFFIGVRPTLNQFGYGTPNSILRIWGGDGVAEMWSSASSAGAFASSGNLGVTHTVPLPKATPGGLNGKIVITGGIITSFVNPT